MEPLVGHFQARLLGAPNFSFNDQAVTIPSGMATAAVAYLAAAREPVERKELLTALWEEGNLGYVRQLLQRLRKIPALATALLVTDTHIKLQALTDTADFIAALDAEAYSAAIGLWPRNGGTLSRQPFLLGLDAPTPRYQEWLDDQRSQLDQLLEDALLALATQFERSSEPARAAAIYRELLQLDELNEFAHLGVMRAELAQKQPVAGLAQYGTLVRALRKEFSGLIEPLPETLEVAAELQRQLEEERGQHAKARHDHGVTPKDGGWSTTPTFIGRAEELEQLQQFLATQEHRLLTIVGQGGSGKSLLAARLSSAVSERFPGGVLHVGLEAIANGSQLTLAVAQALGIRASTSSDLVEEIQQSMATPSVLLMLDNFEHLLEHAQQVADIAQAFRAGSKVIVTSRQPLEVMPEHVFPLMGLTFPQDPTSHGAIDTDAVKLFLQTARRVNPRFQFEPAQLPTVARICSAVEGLPLAVVLAASWLRLMSLEGVLERVLADPLLLASELTDLPERHRRLGTVVTSTMVNLPEHERNHLEQLSVFPSGFDVNAARGVAGTSLHSLIRFVNGSLVSARGGDRFGLHPLIRSWGQKRLEVDGSATGTSHALANYFIETGKTLYGHVTSGRFNEYRRKVTDDIDNFRSSLEHLAASHAYDAGVELCIYLIPWWHTTGHFDEGIRWSQTFLAEASPNNAKGRLHSGVGILFRTTGLMQKAHEQFSLALQEFQTLNNRMAVAAEYGNLASVARNQSDFEQAATYFGLSIAQLRALNEPYALSVQLNNYGLMLDDIGQHEQALEAHEEALGIHQERNDHPGTIASLTNIARTLHALNRVAEAIAIWEKMLDLPDLTGQERHTLKLNLSRAHMDRGETDVAMALATEVLEDTATIASERDTGFALSYLAGSNLRLGDLERAAEQYKRAAEAHRRSENKLELTQALQGLARIAGATKNWGYFQVARPMIGLLWQEMRLDEPGDWLAFADSIMHEAELIGSEVHTPTEPLEAVLEWLLAANPFKKGAQAPKNMIDTATTSDRQ